MRQQGFSLIELMIVIAIIGILAMIAAPQYKSYISRVKVSELLALASPFKGELIEHYAEKGKCPNNNSKADGFFPYKNDINSSTLHSLSVGASGEEFYIGGRKVTAVCLMSMVFRGERSNKNVPNSLKNKTIRLRMAMDKAGIYWQCSVARTDGIPYYDLPEICRNF